MSHYGKHPRLNLEEDPLDQTDTQDLVFVHLHTAELEEVEAEREKKEEEREEEDTDKEKEEKIKDDEMEEYEDDEEVHGETKTEGEEHADEEDDNVSCFSFSSFSVSLPSGSPPSPFSFSSSSSSSLFQDTPEDNEGNASMMPTIPQSPERSFFASSSNDLDTESSDQEEENSGSIQPSADADSLLKIKIREMATDLVYKCLFKYRVKEPITEEEILEIITQENEKYFPDIFFEASKYMEMTFGLDIKENDLISGSYIVANSLSLTYEDKLNDGQKMPRNACLILVLGVIFIEGNCASEEKIWEFLKTIGIYDGQTHIMYGEPREFLTKELVEQNYLVYEQVPNSDPPCFQFLWGARAHAETTKMKVLEFFAKVNGCDPVSFPLLYEEALRDEELKKISMGRSPRLFTEEH